MSDNDTPALPAAPAEPGTAQSPAPPPARPVVRGRSSAPGLSAALLQGLRLLVLWPEQRLRLRPAGQFWLILLLTVLSSVLWQWLETDAPRAFNADALKSDAMASMLILGLSHALCTLCGLPLRSWTLAIELMAALFWLNLCAPLIQLLAPTDLPTQLWVFYGLLGWWLLIVLRCFGRVLHEWFWPLRHGAAMLLAGLMACNWLLLDQERYVYSAAEAQPEAGWDEALDTAPMIEGSAEQVMYAQPRLLDEALARIRPSEAGTPELFVLAFAGDGDESVFRNEADYVDALFSTRFLASQRVLRLVNSPGTVDSHPLATLSNLRMALRGLHERMDAEDLLFLFLTSHGSPDHEFYININPLVLDQIRPDDLAEALREAEIGTRIILVSACYSGGFIPALRDPRALVMTAARADRSSFGCGAESDITYFGRAFLVDALNETSDFVTAFKRARRLVTERERSQDYDHSYPQLELGAQVLPALKRWQATLPEAAAAVPFAPDAAAP